MLKSLTLRFPSTMQCLSRDLFEPISSFFLLTSKGKSQFVYKMASKPFTDVGIVNFSFSEGTAVTEALKKVSNFRVLYDTLSSNSAVLYFEDGVYFLRVTPVLDDDETPMLMGFSVNTVTPKKTRHVYVGSSPRDIVLKDGVLTSASRIAFGYKDNKSYVKVAKIDDVYRHRHVSNSRKTLHVSNLKRSFSFEILSKISFSDVNKFVNFEEVDKSFFSYCSFAVKKFKLDSYLDVKMSTVEKHLQYWGISPDAAHVDTLALYFLVFNLLSQEEQKAMFIKSRTSLETPLLRFCAFVASKDFSFVAETYFS